MNALDRWRRCQDWTYQRLANALQCNHATASRYCQGRRIPEPEAMARIHALTGGAVDANHFYGLPEPRPWIVALAPSALIEPYGRLGWRIWPPPRRGRVEDPEGGAVLMRRKLEDGETWRDLRGELIAAKCAAAMASDSLIASRVDPN